LAEGRPPEARTMTIADNVDRAVGRLAFHGPNRVVVDDQGMAVGWARAIKQYDVMSDVIFIRDDGWMLGAPKDLEHTAEALWHDRWVAVCEPPTGPPVPYEQWREART